MRSMMKVLVLGALCLLPPGGPEGASAAQCPSECRREINDVLCMTMEISSDEKTTVVRYYWSDGPGR